MVFIVIAPRFFSKIFIAITFLGFVVLEIWKNGFQNGLIEGVGLGGLFSLFVWLRLKKSPRSQEEIKKILQPWLDRYNHVSLCEKCGTELPRHRRPENIHQLLWGGWTCPSCGAELDSWGKVRPV